MVINEEKLKRVKEIQEKIFELEEELKSIYNLQIKPEGKKLRQKKINENQ